MLWILYEWKKTMQIFGILLFIYLIKWIKSFREIIIFNYIFKSIYSRLLFARSDEVLRREYIYMIIAKESFQSVNFCVLPAELIDNSIVMSEMWKMKTG